MRNIFSLPKERLTMAKKELSISDKFYIEKNPDMSLDNLSKNLNVSVNVIEDFCKTILKKNDRAKRLMSRPGKEKSGVVSMTQAASMEGDSSNRGLVLEAINRAIAEGDDQKAIRLKKAYDEHITKNKDILKEKYKDIIHYIEKPDDDAEVY